MKKISTLYKKDLENLDLVTQELDERNAWVLEFGIPTRKFDGTACAVIDGYLYKRYDAKEGFKKRKVKGEWVEIPYSKKAPEGAIPCQDKDPTTGHQPYWVKCDRAKPDDKWFFNAFDKQETWEDGTYECCGVHFQGNPESLDNDYLIKHGTEVLDLKDFSYESLKEYLSRADVNIEGIVFHDSSGKGRLCKIRKCDFGVKR